MKAIATHTLAQSWRLLYWRAGLFILVGLVFIVLNNYPALSIGLLSLFMILLGLTAIRFWMVTQAVERTAFWFSLIGLLDIIFGILLLISSDNPEQAISLTFGAWGLVTGFIQATESIYVFLAIRIPDQRGSSLPTIVLHWLNVFIGGGMAFILLLQPFGIASLRIAGLFPIGFSVLLFLLIRQLQRTAPIA